MANYVVTTEQLTGIADAIRTVTGSSAALEFPDGFTDEISSITGGWIEKHATDTLPAENVTIAPNEAVLIGRITLSHGKAVFRVNVSGYNIQTIEHCYNLHISEGAEITLVNLFLHNKSASQQTISAGAISVDVTYYK